MGLFSACSLWACLRRQAIRREPSLACCLASCFPSGWDSVNPNHRFRNWTSRRPNATLQRITTTRDWSTHISTTSEEFLCYLMTTHIFGDTFHKCFFSSRELVFIAHYELQRLPFLFSFVGRVTVPFTVLEKVDCFFFKFWLN